MEIVVTDADELYVWDVFQLLQASTERRRCEIGALAQSRLFGETEEVR